MNKEYREAIKQAEKNMEDVMSRGNEAIGSDAPEFMDAFLSSKEIAERDLRVALIGKIIKAKQEKA